MVLKVSNNLLTGIRALCLWVLLMGLTQVVLADGKPNNIKGQFDAGPAWTSDLTMSAATIMGNSYRYYTAQVANTATLAFLVYDGVSDYDPKWCNGGTFTVNGTPTTTGLNGADNDFSATASYYYKFTIEDATGDQELGVISLGSTDDPNGISIDAVTKTPATPDCSNDVTVNADLDIALRTGEHLWLAYTTDNWTGISFVEFTAFDGDNAADAVIPAQAASASVKYYVFTSQKSDMTGVTSFQAPFYGFVWSSESSYTVAAGTPISVDVDPSNSTICDGDNTTFSITASGTPDYQWQENTGSWVNLSNGGVYSNVTTATMTLTNPGTAKDGNTYRCVISKGACSDINSNAGTLVVNSLSLSAQPAAAGICVGGNTTFSVTSNGTNTPNYKWQESTDGGTVWANLTDAGVYSNTTTATMSITGATAGMDTYDYRCHLTIASCSAINSAQADLALTTASTVSSHPSGVTICAGENTSFTVTGSNVTSYKWQESTDNGGTWGNISDGGVYANSATATLTMINPGAGRDGYDYRCMLINSPCADVPSNAANMDVNANSTITAQPANDEVGEVGTATFTATGDQSPTYQWQENTGSWANLSNGGVYSGVTGSTLTLTNPTSAKSGNQYRIVSTGSGCASGVNSNAATLSVIFGTTGGGDGSWDDPSQWAGGVVPATGDKVVLSHNTLIDQDITVADLEIDAGVTVTNDASSRRISIQASGSLTNNGTWTGNTETIDFGGAGTLDGTTGITANNIELNGALTMSTVATINGTLDMNHTTASISAAPTFGASSTLQYSHAGTVTIGNEWLDTDQSNPGYPNHVHATNNSHVKLTGITNTKYMAGNLSIDAGSQLNMDDMTQSVRVLGDITNAGTLTLSSAGGGDLEIFGDWTNTGTYAHNGRSINFEGTQDPQIITETAGEDWQYFHIDKPSGNVKLATDLTISNTWGDNLIFDDAGGLDLNDQRLTLADGANIDQNYTGTVNISNSGGSGTGVLDLSGQATFTGVDGSKEFLFEAGTTLEMNNQVNNCNQITINGTADVVNASAMFNGSGPVWGTTGVFQLNTGGTELFGDWTATAWANTMYNMTVAAGSRFDMNSDGTITVATATIVNGDLFIWDGSANRDMDFHDVTIGAAGEINMNNTVGADMFVSGDFTITTGGTLTIDNRMIEFDGSADQTISGDWDNSNIFDYLNINNSHATEGVHLGADIEVDQEIRFVDGYLFTNNFDFRFDVNAAVDGANPADTDSHIVTNGSGVVTREDMAISQTFSFPIGQAAGTLNYFKMETAGAVHTTDNISCRVESGTCSAANGWDADTEISNGDDYVNSTWVITEGVAGGTAGDLNFYWYGSQEGSTFTRTASNVYHYTGGAWDDISFNARDNAAEPYKVRTAAPATFSPFTIGDAAPTVLPIELGEFWIQTITSDYSVLNWTTLSEINNAYFIIERSIGGDGYEEIGRVNGTGTSNDEVFYEFVDYSFVDNGDQVYYRLTQVDFDGKSQSFDALAVASTLNFQSAKVVPNPVKEGGAPYLALDPRAKGSQITILDMLGREVWIDSGVATSGGMTILPMLSTGTYIVHIQKGNWVEKIRFVVAK